MDSSVIVPIFNGSRHLPIFWDSLKSNLTEGTEIIIIDDGSTEDILASMGGAANHPQVRVIRNKIPNGFATAVNAGLKVASGSYLFILNCDLILQSDCLENLRQTINSQPNVGLAGATLLYPQTSRIQHAGIAFSETNHCHVFSHLPYDHPIVSQSREVQGIAFAACCVSRSAFDKVGLLNENYFNSYEDFDYCFRLLEKGYKLIVSSDARGFHWERQTGFIRSVRRKDNVARLWRDWGHYIKPDINRYLSQSLKHVKEHIDKCPQPSWTLINLAKGRMSIDAEEFLNGNDAFGRSITDVLTLPQLARDTYDIWLPLVLPFGSARRPTQYIYLVDEFPQLRENSYWFDLRRNLVDCELVVDLCGNIVDTDQIEIGSLV